MPSHNHLHQHIPSGAAVDAGLAQAGHTGGLSVVNTCGNIHRVALAHGNVSGTPAVGTFFLNNLSCTLTVRTGLHIADCSKERLLGKYHLALAAALGTGFGTGSRLCTAAVTGLTGFLHRQVYFLFASKHRLLKGDADAGTQVRSLHRTVAARSAGTPSAKEIAKNIAEYIAKVSTAEIKASGSAGAAVKRGMAKLVVLASFLRITQNRICLRGLLKLFFSLFISRIHVRMIFLCKNTICFFYRRFVRVFIYAQNLIIIPLLFCHNHTSYKMRLAQDICGPVTAMPCARQFQNTLI